MAERPVDPEAASDRRSWQEIEELFAELDELDAGRQAERLREIARQDPKLAAKVATLLERAADLSSVLPAGGALDSLLASELRLREVHAGERCGRFVLDRELGRGGMAVVYEAHHADSSIPQKAAVKLLRPGFDSEESRRRFERELRILARLNHPGIARFLDGGFSDNGLPFLAMERVDGLPIDEHCARRGLDLEQRLDLFVRVAEAVHHAHQNLIVHRDLKPSNVWVSSEGEVKLLDFGIAKLLGGLGDDEPTRELSRLLTPEYASPEQVRGDSITVATDVHQLGMLLFELLTGARARTLGERSWSAIEAEICERPVVRASSAVSAGGLGGGERQADAVRRALRGDLDNIIATALRLEPQRRYSSVASLLEDLRRQRAHLPVSATPDSLRYRSGRFLRRHGVGVAVVLVLLIVGVVYAATVTLQSRRLARERNRVLVEAARADQVGDFMVEVFQAANPFETLGEETTARELLDRAAARIDQTLADQPEVASELRTTLGEVYYRLGTFERAEQLQRAAFAQCEELSGAASDRCIGATGFGLGRTLRRQSRYDEALEILAQSVAARRRGLPETAEETANSLNELGLAHHFRHDYAEARQRFEEALALHVNPPLGREVSASGTASASVADSLSNIGMSLSAEGRTEEALDWGRRALAAWEAQLGSAHPETTIARFNVGRYLQFLRRFAEADPYFRQVLNDTRAVLGDEHPRVATYTVLLGNNLHRLGRLEEAERFVRDGLAIGRWVYPADHPRIAEATMALGRILTDAGRAGEARALLEEAVQIYRSKYDEGDRLVAIAKLSLGNALLDLGEEATASDLLHAALEVLRDHEYWGPEAQNAVARLSAR